MLSLMFRMIIPVGFGLFFLAIDLFSNHALVV